MKGLGVELSLGVLDSEACIDEKQDIDLVQVDLPKLLGKDYHIVFHPFQLPQPVDLQQHHLQQQPDLGYKA